MLTQFAVRPMVQQLSPLEVLSWLGPPSEVVQDEEEVSPVLVDDRSWCDWAGSREALQV